MVPIVAERSAGRFAADRLAEAQQGNAGPGQDRTGPADEHALHDGEAAGGLPDQRVTGTQSRHARPDQTAVVAYRLKFTLSKAAVIRAHVSADQRYELFVDGVRVGRGSERGDRQNWFFESYDLDVPAGERQLLQA